MDIQSTRAYRYVKWCIQPDNNKVGRYIKKQCEQWLDIADGKSDSYIREKDKQHAAILHILRAQTENGIEAANKYLCKNKLKPLSLE